VANIGAVGSDAQFGFAEETVWASGSPTIDNFIPFLSESLQLERNIVMSDAIRGATARSIWREGAERAGSGFYVHDFYPSGTLPEGLRLEIGRTGVSGGTFEYRGCKVNQLTLNCTVGEPLTAVFSFLGKDEITHAANPTSASSISALNPLTFDEGEMLIDANSQEVAGFSLNIANNLVEDKGALGDRYRVAIPRTGFRDVTGTLNLEFDNLDMYNRYTGGTETKLKLTFTSDDMAAGTQAHALIIDCPRIVFTGTTPVVGGPDLIYYDMPFVALFDDDEGNPDYKNEVRIRAITSDASV
jgi:hypothetical protein